jgi:DNA-binding protein H-NS
MREKGGHCKVAAIHPCCANRKCGGLLFLHNSPHSIWKGISVATYLELKEQAEKLLAEAEKMREQEISDAIADIRKKIELYGLTAADLGFAKSGPGMGTRVNKPAKSAAKSAAKYRGPNGETWSGGRGRKPQWVTQALKDGRNLEDFAIKAGR